MKWPSVAARIWSLNINLFDLDRLEAREMSGIIGAKEHGRNRDASGHQGPQANTNPTRRDDFLILPHRASMAHAQLIRKRVNVPARDLAHRSCMASASEWVGNAAVHPPCPLAGIAAAWFDNIWRVGERNAA